MDDLYARTLVFLRETFTHGLVCGRSTSSCLLTLEMFSIVLLVFEVLECIAMFGALES